jgi:hypothetical protein
MSAEIPDGAVFVARAILNSSLWTMSPTDCKVAITCIAICNKRAKKWWDGEREITINPGQFVRSRDRLSKDCHLSIQRVRTSVLHLEKVGFLTRVLTRMYTIYTLPKYLHYQDLAKYSDSVTQETNHISNQRSTSDQPASNHKQQQYSKTIHSESAAKPDKGAPKMDGAVVVDGDLIVLEKISLGISVRLLESVKMSKPIATALGSQKTVGAILRAVQQARRQKKPGGWARMALEGDWALPDPSGDELSEVLGLMKSSDSKRDSAFRSILKRDVTLEKLQGETEEAWFRRVNDELKRRREETKSSGRKGQKAT